MLERKKTKIHTGFAGTAFSGTKLDKFINNRKVGFIPQKPEPSKDLNPDIKTPYDVPENITDQEYANFIDNNEVSEDTLETIVNKIIKHEALSKREGDVFAAKTTKINDLIVKKYDTENKADTDEPVVISTTPEPEPAAPPKKERTPSTPEVEKFIKDLNLEDSIPEGFEALDDLQKLKVVHDLKQRVLDIVKSDAQTQYSEYLKEKVDGKIGKFFRGTFYKGTDIKTLENKAFKEISEDKEGKKIIAEDLILLTQKIKNQKIELGEKNEINTVYCDISNMDKPLVGEKLIVENFNTAANAFAQMPYEWGQKKKRSDLVNFYSSSDDQKRIYEKAKAEYENSKLELLRIKTDREKTGEKWKAMLDVSSIDNTIKMEQLLNTHPEFEKELNDLEHNASKQKYLKITENIINTSGSVVNTLTAKNATNRLLMAGGFGARWAAKGAALATGTTGITFLASTTIGAVAGSIRGWIRGKETLKERQIQARHGVKDTSKEKIKMVDVTRLINGLDKMADGVENAKNEEEKSKLLTKLGVVIEHSRTQTEKGQINFGDTKSALKNQFNFVNSLNRALVLQTSLSKDINKELNEKINHSILIGTEKSQKRTSEAQKSFLIKQAGKGALIGAGAATFGYTLRYVGEQFGWWENLSKYIPWHHEASTINTNQIIQTSGPKVSADDSIANSYRMKNENYYNALHQVKGADVGKSAADLKTKIIESMKTSDNDGGTTAGFKITLGENGVPKNLETVYNEISAEHIPLPANGTVDEAFASKSLNMAENLVKLTEGHNIAGIKAEDFAKVANFKNGVLEIKDQSKFNDIISALEKHASENWDKGVLQSKGAAESYIPKISHENWTKIVHGDGIHDATNQTGLENHQNIDADHIKNFGHHESTETTIEKGGLSGGGKKYPPEDLLKTDPNADNAMPIQKDPTEIGTSPTGHPTIKPDLKNNIPTVKQDIDKQSIHAQNSESQEYVKVNFGYNNVGESFLITSEQLRQATEASDETINFLFPEHSDLGHIVENRPVSEYINLEANKNVRLPLVPILQELRRVTGLEPLRARPPIVMHDETNEEFIKRAFAKSTTQTGKFEKLKNTVYQMIDNAKEHNAQNTHVTTEHALHNSNESIPHQAANNIDNVGKSDQTVTPNNDTINDSQPIPKSEIVNNASTSKSINPAENITTTPEPLKSFDFGNTDHTITIYGDKSGSLEMKFIYDKGGKIIDTDVTGEIDQSTMPDNYGNKEALQALGMRKVDADEAIYPMANKADFLKSLPRDTYEYEFLLKQVEDMRHNIIEDFGDVLNPEEK